MGRNSNFPARLLLGADARGSRHPQLSPEAVPRGCAEGTQLMSGRGGCGPAPALAGNKHSNFFRCTGPRSP